MLCSASAYSSFPPPIRYNLGLKIINGQHDYWHCGSLIQIHTIYWHKQRLVKLVIYCSSSQSHICDIAQATSSLINYHHYYRLDYNACTNLSKWSVCEFFRFLLFHFIRLLKGNVTETSRSITIVFHILISYTLKVTIHDMMLPKMYTISLVVKNWLILLYSEKNFVHVIYNR